MNDLLLKTPTLPKSLFISNESPKICYETNKSIVKITFKLNDFLTKMRSQYQTKNTTPIMTGNKNNENTMIYQSNVHFPSFLWKISGWKTCLCAWRDV